ncbi:MAG: hypothetical protein FWC76_00620 [Defluviitaleaceae bacterium]|nr:hypothetical protein [Defluviitaleaceae bacterium]
MKHVFGENIKIGKDLAIAIGKFDGLHKGHMALISKLKEVAKKQRIVSAVLSFSPHPAAVLGGADIPLILSPQEKLHLLSKLSLDYFIEYPFTREFAQISPDDFLKNIAVEQLKGKALVVGENFRFGHDGAGDVALAKRLSASLGLQVHTMPLVSQGTAEISANSIRCAIANKDFHAVKNMCGRDFFFIGEIAYIPQKNKLLPPYGEYITRTYVDDMPYESITTVGPDVVETHLLNYNSDLYGCALRVEFLDSYSSSSSKSW